MNNIKYKENQGKYRGNIRKNILNNKNKIYLLYNIHNKIIIYSINYNN